MEKAIKGYLSAKGFKYKPSEYSHIRKVTDDMYHAIGYTIDSGLRKHYYHLRFFITISSNTLNDILYEVTDGSVDNRKSASSPAYINIYNDIVMEMEFCGERSVEENIEEFDTIYKTQIQKVFDLYGSQKSIFLCPLYEQYFNILNTPYIWYYVPLAYFFHGDFDKAIGYIDQRVEISRGAEKRILSRYGVLDNDDLIPRRSYETMRENLQKWIDEHRQFKVDDELLPNYNLECSVSDNGWMTKINNLFESQK